MVVIGIAACSPSVERKEGERLSILTTTGILGDAVRNIVADSADVRSLMGPGVDPHLYKASQGDLTLMTDSDVIIYNGLFLEGKMEEIFGRLQKIKPVIAAAEVLDPSILKASQVYENEFDPHVWFDVSMWANVIRGLNAELQLLDPRNAEYYQSNTDKYVQILEALHENTITEIDRIPREQRVLITSHDAFSYFGRAYDIDVRGLQGISTISEAGLRDISDMVKFITEQKIKAVFVETSVSERAINAVVEGCRENGYEVSIGGYLYSDALGEDGTIEGTYIGMVESNVSKIVKNLE